jgi:hypothetical protein
MGMLTIVGQSAKKVCSRFGLMLLAASVISTGCGSLPRSTAPEPASTAFRFGPLPTKALATCPAGTPTAAVISATPTPLFTLAAIAPVPEPIQIPLGVTSVTLEGSIDGMTQVRYVVWAGAGQTMVVGVGSPNVGVLFHISGVDDKQVYKHLLDGEMNWRGVLPLSQQYLITLDAVGGATTYTLDVAFVDIPASEPP